MKLNCSLYFCFIVAAKIFDVVERAWNAISDRLGLNLHSAINRCIILAQSTFSKSVYPTEKLSSLGQHMVFVGCIVDASFPFFRLFFYKDVNFIMEAEWKELAVKPFEVLPASDVRVAQNHFRSVTQGTTVRKCQNCQSKWVIRIEVLCLVLSDVHIKYFIITPRGRLYSSPFHRWEKRGSEKQTCPKVMCKLRFDSKYIHHQAFSSQATAWDKPHCQLWKK